MIVPSRPARSLAIERERMRNSLIADADPKWTLEDLLRKATGYRDILIRRGLPTDNLEDKDVRRFYDAGLPPKQISATLDQILEHHKAISKDPNYEGTVTDPVWFDQRIKDLQEYGKKSGTPYPMFPRAYDDLPYFIDPDETPLPLPLGEYSARLDRDRRLSEADLLARKKLDVEHLQKQKLTPVKYGYSYPGRGGQTYYQPESEEFKFPPESNQVNTQTPALAKVGGAVPPAPAATTLNAARAGNLGAAGNINAALINNKYGALLNQAKLIGRHLAPQKIDDQKDKWLTAFQFFTNMAAAASEPGATAIGAMGKAGAATVETLIEERKQKRAEELASTKMGVGLITALGKPRPLKVGAQHGEQAKYMNPKEAEEYLLNKGLDPNSPNLPRLIKALKPPTDSMLGKNVVNADAFVQMIPIVQAGKIVDFNLTSMVNPIPRSAAYFRKRMADLAKDDKMVDTLTQVLPQVKTGLKVILNGKVDTGILPSLILPLEQMWYEAFGTKVPEKVSQARTLESLSNFLAPKMRPKGSGSTSDMEFDAYRKAILALKNPRLTNYLALYSFLKTQQNSVKANSLEKEILVGGGTPDDVRKAVEKMNLSLFESYKGDPKDNDALNKWYKSLPRGAVIYNIDSEGKKLYPTNSAKQPVGLFIVKGWKEI